MKMIFFSLHKYVFVILIFVCKIVSGNELISPPVESIPLYSSYSPDLNNSIINILNVNSVLLPGFLRVSIGEAKNDDSWFIIFRSPGKEPIKIDSDMLKKIAVYDRVVQIPLVNSGIVTAEFSPNSPKISLVEILRLPNTSKPLFQMGAWNVRKLNGYSNCSEHEYPTSEELVACALVLIRHDYPGGWEWGTGIQVAPGYIITALHVVTDESGNLNGAVRAIFGLPQECSADPKNCVLAETVKIKGVAASEGTFPLDYALLKINTPADFTRYIVPFASKQYLSLAKTNNTLSSIKFDAYIVDGDQNNGNIMAEKYVSSDEECKLYEWSEEPLTNPTSCGRGNFRHRCDTHSGSSGGAMFLRGTNSFVALHFQGLKADPKSVYQKTGNCGIPLSRIIEDIDFQDALVGRNIIEPQH